MPKLTLRFKDIEIRDYPVAMGQALTVGRKHSNDIVIDNMAVSGNHARIEAVATAFVLRDLGSTNGTFVNGQQVAIHHLRHNDVISIGKHELHFEHPESVKTIPGVRDYQVEKTRILDISAYRDITHGSMSGNKAADTPPQPFWGRLLKKLFG